MYWSIVYFILAAVQTTVAAHDTTGGMSTKIAEAASIAAMGIDVYIVEVMEICVIRFIT